MTASIQRDYYGYRAIYQREVVLNCVVYKIREEAISSPICIGLKLGKSPSYSMNS